MQKRRCATDAFKFVGIGLDRLNFLSKVSEIQLSKCIDDAFVVPDAGAELAGKPSLELADAAVALAYKVIEISICFNYFVDLLFTCF